ncbi:cyclic nucleotide-gated cation channel-like [Sarcoptes scabiei]|nr:cyclic nucleotide-gated cation channel-like [Sarcoptes scabiei]
MFDNGEAQRELSSNTASQFDRNDRNNFGRSANGSDGHSNPSFNGDDNNLIGSNFQSPCYPTIDSRHSSISGPHRFNHHPYQASQDPKYDTTTIAAAAAVAAAAYNATAYGHPHGHHESSSTTNSEIATSIASSSHNSCQDFLPTETFNPYENVSNHGRQSKFLNCSTSPFFGASGFFGNYPPSIAQIDRSSSFHHSSLSNQSYSNGSSPTNGNDRLYAMAAAAAIHHHHGREDLARSRSGYLNETGTTNHSYHGAAQVTAPYSSAIGPYVNGSDCVIGSNDDSKSLNQCVRSDPIPSEPIAVSYGTNENHSDSYYRFRMNNHITSSMDSYVMPSSILEYDNPNTNEAVSSQSQSIIAVTTSITAYEAYQSLPSAESTNIDSVDQLKSSSTSPQEQHLSSSATKNSNNCSEESRIAPIASSQIHLRMPNWNGFNLDLPSTSTASEVLAKVQASNASFDLKTKPINEIAETDGEDSNLESDRGAKKPRLMMEESVMKRDCLFAIDSQRTSSSPLSSITTKSDQNDRSTIYDKSFQNDRFSIENDNKTNSIVFIADTDREANFNSWNSFTDFPNDNECFESYTCNGYFSITIYNLFLPHHKIIASLHY